MSNLRKLTEKQFPRVAGVWGGPQAIPQIEVDSKGRVIAISEVPTPSYPSLISAQIRGTELLLIFDQALELSDQGLIGTCLVDGGEWAIGDASKITDNQISIILAKEVFVNQVLLISLQGFRAKDTGLEGKIVQRQARNLGRNPDLVSEQVIQELGIGATILSFDEGFRLVSSKLNEGILNVWSLGSQIAQTQQVTVGTCTGLTPLVAWGPHLAIAVGARVSLFLWDKSCQSFVLKAEVDILARALALADGLLFIVTDEGFEVYDTEGGKLERIGIEAQPSIRQVFAQGSGYLVAFLINDQIEIWTRRTLTKWAKSTGIALGSLDSTIAFDGQSLVVTSEAQKTTQVWAKNANNWIKSGKWAFGGTGAYLQNGKIAISNWKTNKVLIAERVPNGLWANAETQILTPGPGIREDFGQSVALGVDYVAVGSPQSSTIRVFRRESKWQD